MRNIFLKIFLLTFLFLSPLISSAEVTPLGLKCDPDVLEPGVATFCPVHSGISTANRIFHLKWDMKSTYKNPICRISCAHTGNSQYDVICANINPLNKPPYNWHIYTRDTDNFLNATGTRADFRPKDDVYIRKALPGQSYGIYCEERCDSSLSAAEYDYCIHNKNVKQTGAHLESVEPCEVSFKTIADSLAKGAPTYITEASFESWTEPEARDNATLSRGLGSGDIIDVKNTMDGMQSCQRIPHPTDPGYYNFSVNGYDNVVSKIKSSTGNEDPLIISMYDEKGGGMGHALVAVSFVTLSTTTSQIQVIDSNSAVNYFLSCQKKRSPVIPGQGYAYFLSCQMPLDTSNNYIIFLTSTLSSQRLDCGVGKRVRPDPASWLVSNLPSFSNATTTANPEGICFGYSEFIRNVACFGNFTGYDFHPNDGQYVGKNCDKNHYYTSAPTAKNDNSIKQSFLANIYQAFSSYLRGL